MIPEYPGYGMSTGKPSERSLYACADSAFDQLQQWPGVDGSKIVAAGWSLGAAVATDLAARRTVSKLAIFSAFTNAPDMARRVAPWLPTSLILSYRFDNERKVATLTCPVFIAHGRHDQIVPFEMSRRLAAAAKGPVTYLPIDADHNDLFESGGEELMGAFQKFLQSAK